MEPAHGIRCWIVGGSMRAVLAVDVAQGGKRTAHSPEDSTLPAPRTCGNTSYKAEEEGRRRAWLEGQANTGAAMNWWVRDARNQADSKERRPPPPPTAPQLDVLLNASSSHAIVSRAKEPPAATAAVSLLASRLETDPCSAGGPISKRLPRCVVLTAFLLSVQHRQSTRKHQHQHRHQALQIDERAPPWLVSCVVPRSARDGAGDGRRGYGCLALPALV